VGGVGESFALTSWRPEAASEPCYEATRRRLLAVREASLASFDQARGNQGGEGAAQSSRMGWDVWGDGRGPGRGAVFGGQRCFSVWTGHGESGLGLGAAPTGRGRL